MLGPHLGLFIAAERGQRRGLVLLQHEILHRKTRPSQRSQQHVFVETQGLEPLRMAGAHHEPSALPLAMAFAIASGATPTGVEKPSGNIEIKK